MVVIMVVVVVMVVFGGGGDGGGGWWRWWWVVAATKAVAVWFESFIPFLTLVAFDATQLRSLCSSPSMLPRHRRYRSFNKRFYDAFRRKSRSEVTAPEPRPPNGQPPPQVSIDIDTINRSQNRRRRAGSLRLFVTGSNFPVSKMLRFF
jgi:hypothetical protein